MSDESKEKGPKIIVDDDWKSRAQEEKEELEKKQRETRGGDTDEGELKLPPASFSMLISTLATQAMAALGRVPDPIEGKLVKRLELAKHHIDMIAELEKKTAGNLTAEESALVSNVLHELRMDYVAGGYHPPPATEAESPIVMPGNE